MLIVEPLGKDSGAGQIQPLLVQGVGLLGRYSYKVICKCSLFLWSLEILEKSLFWDLRLNTTCAGLEALWCVIWCEPQPGAPYAGLLATWNYVRGQTWPSLMPDLGPPDGTDNKKNESSHPLCWVWGYLAGATLYSEDSCCSSGVCGHLREFIVQAQGSCHLHGNCKLLRKSATNTQGAITYCNLWSSEWVFNITWGRCSCGGATGRGSGWARESLAWGSGDEQS